MAAPQPAIPALLLLTVEQPNLPIRDRICAHQARVHLLRGQDAQ